MHWVFLIVLDIPASLACWGQGSGNNYYYYDYTTVPDGFLSTLFLKGKKGDAVNRNIKSGYGGFKVPHEVEQLWRYWLQQHELELEDEERNGKGGGKFNRGPGSGWPDRWMGLGNGQGGVAPPPWAYVPIEGTLPAFCYLEPARGTCDEKLTRYGFNPFSQQCEEFEYSGCGENQNNFEKKEKCEIACMPLPIAGCELDTMQYIEES